MRAENDVYDFVYIELSSMLSYIFIHTIIEFSFLTVFFWYIRRLADERYGRTRFVIQTLNLNFRFKAWWLL